MAEAYIYDAVRTPRGEGKPTGSLHAFTPISLATQTLQAVQARNNLDTSLVDDVTLGVVDPIGEQGGNIARIAVLNAGFDESAAGIQINRFCASGLEAINIASAKVMAGQSELMIAGGVESMSRVPMMSSGGPWSVDPSVALKTYFVPQGISADLIATKHNYSREDCDKFAVESHKRAHKATEAGSFKNSIFPIKNNIGEVVLDKDEHIRLDCNLKSLSELKPSFAQMGDQFGFDAVAMQKYPEVERINHVHHAGNSSGMVDGASVMLIGSKAIGKKLGIKPRAKIKSFASIGSEPCIMLTGPSDASEKALKIAKMTAKDIDLFEVNEAFAAVVLKFMETMKVPHKKVNVNGGAIAMGHPLGATGAMILGTLLDELEAKNLSTGLATLCVGAGMATSTIIERI